MYALLWNNVTRILFISLAIFKAYLAAKNTFFLVIAFTSNITLLFLGTSSRDSLLSWIRFLQRDNPDLENIPILFTLHSPLGPVVPLSEEELSGEGKLKKS